MENAMRYVQLYVILLDLQLTFVKGAASAGLWGRKVVLQHASCQYWSLRPEHPLPALQEFSVCVNVQRSINNSAWTAFMYRHPNRTRVELGLGGQGGFLHVWLFGTNWSPADILTVGHWHSICISCSCSLKQAHLAIDGRVVIQAQAGDPIWPPGVCSLASAGSLTLGAAHYFVGGTMQTESGTNLQGSISLFRVWGRAQISTHTCSDGDVLQWHSRVWDKNNKCQLVRDETLKCDWSLYEVKMQFLICWFSGNRYDAEEITRHWLRKKLPLNIRLNTVTVSSLVSSAESCTDKGNGKGTLMYHSKFRWFKGLAQLKVTPKGDAGYVQDKIFRILKKGYRSHNYILHVYEDILHVYPIDWNKFVPLSTQQTSITTLKPTGSTPRATEWTEVVPQSTSKTNTTTLKPTGTTTRSTFSTLEATEWPEIVPQSTPQTTSTILIPTDTTSSTTSTILIPTDTTSSTTSTILIPTDTTSSTTSTILIPTDTTSSTTSTILIPIDTTSSTTSITLIPTDTTTRSTIMTPEAIDRFFKVSMTLTIKGSDRDPENIVQTWLYGTLSSKGISVLNFQMTSPKTRVACLEECSDETGSQSVRSLTLEESCTFQMLVPKCADIEETRRQIHNLLWEPYSNGSFSLAAELDSIHIAYIHPGLCPQHVQQTRKGLYIWPRTLVEYVQEQPCKADPGHIASRKCSLGAATNQAVWIAQDLHECPTVVHTISDLGQIEVTNDTAEDVVLMLMDMQREQATMDPHDLLIMLTTLEAVLKVSVITPALGKVVLNITSNILDSQSNLHPFTNSILNILTMVGDRMSNFNGSSLSLVTQTLALSMVKIDTTNFYNLTFGVTSMNNGPHPEIYINQQAYESTVALITLPAALRCSLPQNNHTSPRVQFQFFGAPALFNDNQKGKTLNTYVVSASVINATKPIKGLKEPVIVTLHHLDTDILGKSVQCAYWDFNKNGGRGGWSRMGCWEYNVTTNYTTCMCDHLTHFGVLLDVSRTAIDKENEKILTVITYTGCGISSFFLGITVLTYSLLEKLRRDHPSQILLNLSIALLGLNLIFLINSWLSSFGIYGLCVAIATAQHYFLLTSFTWMFLEAVNMYFALVKVFNVYIPSYILKFCIFGWGMPLVICCLVLVVKKDAYDVASTGDSLANSEMFCWIQDDVVFYVSVVGYVSLVLLCNTSVFLVVLVQIRKMHTNQPAGMQSGIQKELRGMASLTLLLGLTWAVAFFTWGPAKVPLLYLFSILNSLQGFFIFVFHCLMKDNVRKQWRIHLCLGHFKLQEYSDWSYTSPAVAKPKANQFPTFPMVASVRSNKSNSTESSSASSDCSQRQVSTKRPNLGVMYQRGLVLPRAQLGPSPSPQTTHFPRAGGTEIHSWLPGASNDIYFK